MPVTSPGSTWMPGNAWFSSGITATELGETCHRCIWVWREREKVWALKAVDSACEVHGRGPCGWT